MPIISTGITTLDVLKANVSEELLGIIIDVVKTVPEVGFFQASPIRKNEFKSLAVTQLPKVGFRQPGNFWRKPHSNPVANFPLSETNFPLSIFHYQFSIYKLIYYFDKLTGDDTI
ncbi:MAG: hypothetical protein LBQ50_05300 [Planctomycetaceae bacterium]|jgi:hypothetical protein|nr:hypothetical protein [Planctomycetaceae bacterium]